MTKIVKSLGFGTTKMNTHAKLRFINTEGQLQCHISVTLDGRILKCHGTKTGVITHKKHFNIVDPSPKSHAAS